MPTDSRHPLDTLFEPATLISIFAAGELLALILALAPELQEARLIRFGVLSFAIQWIAIFTLSLLYLFRKPLRAWPVWRVILLATTLMFALTVVSSGITQWLLVPGQSIMQTGLRLFGALLCMMLFGLLALRSHWTAQSQEYRAKQSELSALQARVDPHFLFNTLNTAIALLHARPDAAEQVLLDLSDLFRAALSETQIISLEKELELTDRYLEIEQIRFGDRLRIMRQYPEQLPDISLPSLSIQPLVENAIRHGIEPMLRGGCVVIRVDAQRDKILIEIENERGRADASPPRAGHKVGVAGVKARILAATQGIGSLETESDDTRHLARIVLPR
ncbi:sensor histidine kinase [Lysobacter soyae]|uniref:Histidine kinase n=1 Tax=Lysobacter soyae TaxID=2764185 RepID=A0ABX8WQ04_9GAMM|nr:histidine kinase [Lysobacter sp. CJ11]QYR52538.1 histidine kinase [Lysobacter sp. CJ11]